jgi:hypothetical protein
MLTQDPMAIDRLTHMMEKISAVQDMLVNNVGQLASISEDLDEFVELGVTPDSPPTEIWEHREAIERAAELLGIQSEN